MPEQRAGSRMVRWDQMEGLIQGHDPAALASALDDLQGSPGWAFVTEVIARYTQVKRDRVFQTIEGDDEHQKLANHNRNVVTVKTLESVLELVRVARDRCVEELKKKRPGG